MKLTYLQSSEPLERKIYITKSAPEFNLSSNEALLPLKPLYGLSDSGDLWHVSLDIHMKKDLKMKSMIADPVLYMKFNPSGELIGMNGSYVDDVLQAGDMHFMNIARYTDSKFDTSGDEEPTLTPAGQKISKPNENAYAVDQSLYLKNMKPVTGNSTWSEFSSKRIHHAWNANTRPDICVDISQLASVTKEVIAKNGRNYIKRFSRSLKFANELPNQAETRKALSEFNPNRRIQ